MLCLQLVALPKYQFITVLTDFGETGSYFMPKLMVIYRVEVEQKVLLVSKVSKLLPTMAVPFFQPISCLLWDLINCKFIKFSYPDRKSVV